MAVSQADVVTIAPEFATLGAPEMAAAIAQAVLVVNPLSWGTLVDMGAKYLAAHFLAMTHPELSSPGPVQSEQVGAVRRSFAVAAPTSPTHYDSTRYGMIYMSLLRTLGLSPQVI